MSMIDLPNDIEDAAKRAAGNWRKFQCFAWDHSRDDDADRRAIFNTTHRDANILTQSNHAQIEKTLEPFTEGDDPDVRAHCAGHWAVGWVEGFDVRVYDAAGNITAAFREIHTIAMALADYPVLSDDDFSLRELDALHTAIEQIGRRMIGTRARKSWPGDVAHWLYENEQGECENTDGTGAYPSEESVRRALGSLGKGWLNPEHARLYRAEK